MPTSTAAILSPPAKWRGRGAYIRQFITKPSMVGAFCPSSSHLAREVVRGLDLRNASAVLEFGPGTGVLTDCILPGLGKNTKFVSIELNDEMVAAFRRRLPRVTLIHDSCEHARRICDQHGIDKADIIVSGLPFASFAPELQDRIMRAVDAVLKPGGTFVTFGYHIGTLLPAGKRFAQRLHGHFTHIEKSKPVWRNMPPAFVYRCVK